jgi:hypothetical protein
MLVQKHEERLLGRTRHRWEDNIKINIKVIWYKDMKWIHLAQDRVQSWVLVNKGMLIQVS